MFALIPPSIVGAQSGKRHIRAANITGKMLSLQPGQVLLAPWNVE